MGQIVRGISNNPLCSIEIALPKQHKGNTTFLRTQSVGNELFGKILATTKQTQTNKLKIL